MSEVLIIGFQGFGTLLMEEAERIAREEHGSVKLAVISGELPLNHCVDVTYNKRRCRHEGLLPKIGLRAGWSVYEQIAALDFDALLSTTGWTSTGGLGLTC